MRQIEQTCLEQIRNRDVARRKVRKVQKQRSQLRPLLCCSSCSCQRSRQGPGSCIAQDPIIVLDRIIDVTSSSLLLAARHPECCPAPRQRVFSPTVRRGGRLDAQALWACRCTLRHPIWILPAHAGFNVTKRPICTRLSASFLSFFLSFDRHPSALLEF